MSITTFIELGKSLITVFANFFNIASQPIQTMDLPEWVTSTIKAIYPQLLDLSLIQIMFGVGLTIYVILAIVKFIVELLPIV